MKYRAFIHLPELQAYREGIGEEQFWRTIRWLELEPETLAVAPVFPGAISGIEQLTRLGQVAYYTARHCWFDEEKSVGMQKATYGWLASHAFPQADRVVFCENVAAKRRSLSAMGYKSLEERYNWRSQRQQVVCVQSRSAMWHVRRYTSKRPVL